MRNLLVFFTLSYELIRFLFLRGMEFPAKKSKFCFSTLHKPLKSTFCHSYATYYYDDCMTLLIHVLSIKFKFMFAVGLMNMDIMYQKGGNCLNLCKEEYRYWKSRETGDG